MKRRLARLASIPLLTLACAAPAMAGFKVAAVDIAGRNERGDAVRDIAMPFVQPATDRAAANINDALYLALFETPAPAQAVARFDVGEVTGTESQDYDVVRNDRIFTVQFNTEGCGAYCESYRQVFSFDARTGRRLTADDVLTSAGQQEALRRLGRQRIAEYTRQIADNKAALQEARRTKAKQDEIDDLQQRIELNTNCLAQAREPDSPDSLHWHRLNPTAAALEVTAGRCSNHASLALDDVDEVTVRIPYAAIRAQMTPYGRAVLLGEGEGKPTALFGQVLRGTIGASPVTLLLSDESGDRVQGMYFYDRQRKMLGLAGRRKGNTTELDETVAGAPAPTGKFVLAVDGLNVKGTWSDPKSRRQLPVVLSAP